MTVNLTYDGNSTPPVAAGSYAVAAVVDDSNYEGSATGLLVVAKASQTINFPDPGSQISTAQVVLAATASSGLSVGYAVTSGPGVLDGATLSFTGTGIVEIVASQAGNQNWNAAEPVMRTIEVVPPPAPQLEISLAAVNVREGGEGRFFVRLDLEPATNVVVTVSRVTGDTIEIQSGASRVFKPSNWSVWQSVILTAVTDENATAESATFQVSAQGVSNRYVEATTLDDEIAENLALATNGAAVSGSSGARQLPQLIDGIHNVSTNYGYVGWGTVPPGTLTLDLGDTQTVTRVRVMNWDWVYRTQRYQLESSCDGVAWTNVADAESADHQGWDDWPVASTKARYLRLTALTNSSGGPVVVSEWEVYGQRSPPPLLAISREQVNVREGGEGRFFLRLNQEPATNVVVTISRATGEAITVQSGASRAFKPSNWSTWQAVSLAAVTDENTTAESASFRISVPGMDDRFVEAVTLDDDIGENLAPLASITVFKAQQATQAIDGVHTSSANYGYTVWTNVPPGTMTLDLQSMATVSRVRVQNWDWTYRIQTYQLDSSVDGSNWTLLANASAEARHGWDDWAVTNPPFRYLRFTGLSNSVGSYVCLAEWEVYGTRAPLQHLAVSKTNVNVREDGQGRFFVRLTNAPTAGVVVHVARVSGSEALQIQAGAARSFNASNWNGWQAVAFGAAADASNQDETAIFRVWAAGYEDVLITATSMDDDALENLALASSGTTISGTSASQIAQVIDGVHTSSANYGYTVWTETPPGTMTLDLQAEMPVTQIRVLNWDWVYRVHRYRIESSADGTNWQSVADASDADHHGWDNWAVTNSGIRYLRFTGLSNSANSTVCLAEWEVYGTRPARRRSIPAGGADSAAPAGTVSEPLPLTVVTSEDDAEHTNGWAAVDGDSETLWEGRPGAGGWYIAVGYDAPVRMTNLVVELAEGSATNLQLLISQDGTDWTEWPEDSAAPVEASYLWLLFPGEAGIVPRVAEIRPEY